MGENFMSAQTQIQDLVSKLDQIASKASSLLYSAIKSRISSGNVSKNMENDIRNSLNGLPAEMREKVLIDTIILMASNSDNTVTYTASNKKKSGDRSSLFRSY